MSMKLDSCRCPTGVRDRNSADVRLDIIAIAFFFSRDHRVPRNWCPHLISLLYHFFFRTNFEKYSKTILHFEHDDNGKKKLIFSLVL